MSQEHGAVGDGAEQELVAHHDLPGTPNGTAGVTLPELRGDDEDVAGLSRLDLLHHRDGTGVLPEAVRVEPPFQVVVESPGLADLRENQLERVAVARRQLLPPRDGEPSFGELRKLEVGQRLLQEAKRGLRVELREDLDEKRDLLRDVLHGVTVGVRVAGLDLLVRVLVRDREVAECSECRLVDGQRELVAVLDDALGAILVETESFERLLDRDGTELYDLSRLS